MKTKISSAVKRIQNQAIFLFKMKLNFWPRMSEIWDGSYNSTREKFRSFHSSLSLPEEELFIRAAENKQINLS